jgi:hypothetical protein
LSQILTANSRQKTTWRSPLVRELAWVLVIKFIALFLIWAAFFSDPIDKTTIDAHLQQTLFSLPNAVPDQ